MSLTPQEASLTTLCNTVPIMHSFNMLLHYLYRTQHYHVLYCLVFDYLLMLCLLSLRQKLYNVLFMEASPVSRKVPDTQQAIMNV